MPKRRYLLQWTGPALRGLVEIVSYIGRGNPDAATRLVDRIQAHVSDLPRFPHKGRRIPEFPASGLRELVIDSYRVIYRVQVKERRIEIIAVVHGARRLTSPMID